MKVCMFVINNCVHDARVLKEAKTLTDAGFDVRIIARLDEDTQPFEQKGGFRIIRVDCRGLHIRILRLTEKAVTVPVTLGWALVLSVRSRFQNRRPWQLGDKSHRLGVATMKAGSNRIGRGSESALAPKAVGAGRFQLHLRQFLSSMLRRSPFLLVHGLLTYLDFYYRNWQVIKNEPADVYHSHDLNTLLLGWFSKRRTGGKLVYDAHELFTELAYVRGAEKLAFKLLEKRLIHRADAVIVPGEYRSRYLSEKYGIPAPTIVANCPPLGGGRRQAGSLREKLGIEDTMPIIIYTGGYIAGRGLENLVLSALYLNEGVIVFMGWGRLEQKLREMVTKNGLWAKVLFTEPVPPEDLVEHIASASVGVAIYQFTSLNNYYASPNKLYEYMHAGLPVVSSDFPALKEIVEGYQLGRPFDPEVPEDIASSINDVLSDERKYDEMRKNALEAAKIFNWENESSKLLATYERLSLRSDG